MIDTVRSKPATRLLAVLVALSVAFLVACSGTSEDDPTPTPEPFSRDYPLSAGKLIYVDNNNGTTRIVSGEKSEAQSGMVRVEAVFENEKDIIFQVTEDQSQLIVTATSRKTGGLLGLVGQSYSSGAEIVIHIPSASNPVEVNTENGNVAIEDFHGESIVHVENGSVSVSSSTGNFDLSAGNGRVNIASASGMFNLSTGNGRINFTGSFDEGGSNSFTTKNGGVDVKIDGEPSLSIDAEVSSSDARVNSSLELDTVLEDEGRVLRGSIGPSSSTLMIRAGGNGSITLSQSEVP